MKLPIGKDDIVVDLSARRPSGLPIVYQTFQHPKVTTKGNIYYTIDLLTREDMARIVKLEEELEIPQGNRQSAVDQGKIIMILH